MSTRVWLIVGGLFAILVFGPLAYFYAPLSPRLELVGPLPPRITGCRQSRLGLSMS